MDPLQTIIDFVQGSLTSEEFKNEIFTNEAFEKLLDDTDEISSDSYIGLNTYLFIIQQDFSDPGDVLSIQGALTQFLDRRNVQYNQTNEHSDLFDLLLEIQPAYLDIDTLFLKNKVLEKAPDLPKTELKKWLKSRIKELFKYATKPPAWIQSPNWPIKNESPLIFLGQLKISDYFHDEAQAYVFHDPETGSCETIIQTY